MCEEGCVCRIKAGGGCLRLGGLSGIPWKGSQQKKRGGETKIFKNWGKLDRGMGAWKKRGLEPPYKLWIETLEQGVKCVQS